MPQSGEPTLRDAVATGLKNLRADAGMSLERLGQRVDLNKQTVHQFETGKTGDYLDKIEAIARACGGEIVMTVIGRGAGDLRRILAVARDLPPRELGDLAALVELWAGLPPMERELMFYTGQVRARSLAQASTSPPPDNVFPLKQRRQ